MTAFAVEPPALGILMLDTAFPRVRGDAGNPASWPFPVLIEVVAGASPERVVRARAAGLVDAFAAAGSALVARGAEAIITTCGFLALHQAELASRLQVPFAASSLVQLPLVARLLPAGRRPGVVTIDAAALTRAHLLGAGADPELPVAGVPPDGEFARTFLGNRGSFDVAAAERELVAAARSLVRRCPDVGAIVLECANMPPYAAAVARAVGVPVYDLISLGRWLHAGLSPAAFPA